MKKISFIFFILIMGAAQISAQKFEGLAETPPMGWNSWNSFQTNINENMIKRIADVMVSSGMKDAGYKYLVLDDGWMAMKRDSITGNLVPDPVKFPHGMKAVADYVHSKGLKFGLYNCAGTNTCQGYPGTRGYEYQDARLYASWGVDYFKYDWCNTKGINAKEAYTTMSKALRKAGRPIVFSVCEWGLNKPWEWATPIGHLWRTTDDIYPVFDSMHNYGTWSAYGVMKILDLQKGLRKYAGPGHWNDPDMLEVGNGMSVSEDRAHFSMWCMLAAPLITGNDLRKMSKETLDILINKDAISIDQDSLGIEGFKYSDKDSLEVWFKPLQNGNWAVCFLNRSNRERNIDFNWKEKVITDVLSHIQLNANINTYKIKDVWTKKNLGTTKRGLKAKVHTHDVLMLTLLKKN
jgi:alpha-galactosidase